MKICTKCGMEKDKSQFHKNGPILISRCKKCIGIQKSLHYKKNRKKILEKKKDYWSKNKVKIYSRKKTYSEKYEQINKKRLKEYRKKYGEDNREYLSDYHRRWAANRRSTDLNFRLRNALRCRLYSAIKNNQKVGSAVSDLGCSVGELRIHLESKFQPGMSWENYGDWHIDHIIPLCYFDLSDRKQFLQACNYSNLQPLWEIDNLSKGGKIL